MQIKSSHDGHEFSIEISQVFFVDFGYTMSLQLEELFKFPRECAAVPFQAALLTIGDVETNSNRNLMVTEFMRKNLTVAMAVVR